MNSSSLRAFMEPTNIELVIKSLGLDPVQVGQWATLLLAWRFLFKLVSSKIQEGLESAIKKAQETNDGQIIGWITYIIQSLPYRVTAWIVDTVISVKLPLKPKEVVIENSSNT